MTTNSSLLDRDVDHALIHGGVLMISPDAIPDLQANTRAEDWTVSGNHQFYRGIRLELHDEWSWGWLMRWPWGLEREPRDTDGSPKGPDPQGLDGLIAGIGRGEVIAQGEAMDLLTDLQAHFRTPPTDTPDGELAREFDEDQQRRREELVQRISMFCDHINLPGEDGDAAYDLLREAAARIGSDRLRFARLTPPVVAQPTAEQVREAAAWRWRVLLDDCPDKHSRWVYTDISGDLPAEGDGGGKVLIEPLYTALPKADDGLRLPTALSEQACTIGKSGSTVTIDCENGDEANEVMDWLVAALSSDTALHEGGLREAFDVRPCVGANGHRTSWDICHPSGPDARGVGVVASCYGSLEQARTMAAALQSSDTALQHEGGSVPLNAVHLECPKCAEKLDAVLPGAFVGQGGSGDAVREVWKRRAGTAVATGEELPHAKVWFETLADAHSFDELLHAALSASPTSGNDTVPAPGTAARYALDAEID